MAIGKRINVPTDFFAIHLGDMKVSDYGPARSGFCTGVWDFTDLEI
jgi:hypothetical protein